LSITRPLSSFSEALNRLTTSLDQPPAPEAGPREIRWAAHSLNILHARLRRRLEERTRTLAGVSHDLKRPLTRMRLRAEMLADAPQRVELLRDIDEMHALASAALAALKELAAEEASQPVDVNALLRTLENEFRRSGARVCIHGRAIAPYPAQPLALKRCLANLIDNAVKYGGEAKLYVLDGATLRIVVADDGPGLPPADLERVFEPFYRTGRRAALEGAGLGLTIAREAAVAHGGRLELRNGPRGGLEAQLTLPRTAATATMRPASPCAQRSFRSVPLTAPPEPDRKSV
jgi:signal transduction histidine kinase